MGPARLVPYNGVSGVKDEGWLDEICDEYRHDPDEQSGESVTALFSDEMAMRSQYVYDTSSGMDMEEVEDIRI